MQQGHDKVNMLLIDKICCFTKQNNQFLLGQTAAASAGGASKERKIPNKREIMHYLIQLDK